MNTDPLYAGLDLGTSGARAMIIDHAGQIRAEGKAPMALFGDNHRSPRVWWQSVRHAFLAALQSVNRRSIVSIAVDGTSGTMLPTDKSGYPLTDGSMYNDSCLDKAVLEKIKEHAPSASAAHGATSGLARALVFCNSISPEKILHQADWISGQFSGSYSSDENNALKTGYDPALGVWPAWISETGLDQNVLPDVKEPGECLALLTRDMAREFDLPETVVVVAGTTDGCASFLATGASEAGDGVSALGTTLTLKVLSEKPIFDADCGVYSHRLRGMWLAGGASNSGGNVLLHFFNADQLARLSLELDPEVDSGLDYYPLIKPGERFPIADVAFAPRVTPRPANEVQFLKGLLEGISRIEKRGYEKLIALGAPELTSVRTVGGGAQNMAWARLRERQLDVPLLIPLSEEAAYGTALLARDGAG